ADTVPTNAASRLRHARCKTQVPPYDCPGPYRLQTCRARTPGPCFVPRSLPSFAPLLQHSPLCPRHLFSLSLPVWPLVANATIHRRPVRPRWLRRLAHGLEPGSATTVPRRRCTRSHLVSHRNRHTDALIPSHFISELVLSLSSPQSRLIPLCPST
ncbi:hypothetical protein B0H14DRAFT_2821753, partial [Mycena olivaceomarginata]